MIELNVMVSRIKSLRVLAAFAALSVAALSVLALPLAVQAQSQDVPQGSPLSPSGERERETEEPADRPDQGDLDAVGSTVFEPSALGPNDGSSNATMTEREREQENALDRALALREPPEPGEFQRYVSEIADRDIIRYGQDLLLPASRDFATPATAVVPPEYRLNVGDSVVLYLNGSVQGTVEREIDNDGNIFLPSVGSVHLAGVRYADLRDIVLQAIGREYRFFDVSVSVQALRGIRVYVTGFANNPGAFSVNSLSTLVNAVFQAGGPSAGGSFRSVKLYRNGREVADFDLYQLLREANRTGDLVLQNEDVLFISPAGEQVAVLGSVQEEAIYELRAGETLADALALAGGPNVLGDPDRLYLYRTSEVPMRGPQEITSAQFATQIARGGDIVNVLSRGTLLQPIARQSVVVRVEGEVNVPGNYYVTPTTSLQEVLELAGGLTDRAYLYGSRLERRSVRDQQRLSYAEALEQLEFTIASAPLIGSSANDDTRGAAQIASAQQVLELLRSREPDGRVILNLDTNSTALPAGVMLEQQDRLVIPPRPTTVGVFGAVYRPASFLIEDVGLELRDYIARAGGAQRAADTGRSFVVRANGDVLTRENGMLTTQAQPGDVVFVPIRGQSTDFWDRVIEITSIVFQLGVTAAAVNSIR